MGDAEKIETRYNFIFIHNVFGHFYKDLLDYFSDYLYPRFEWKVIGTYHKAVEYLSKLEQYGGEDTDQPNVPALILNPSGDFGLDETYGKMLWRSPNLMPGYIKRVFDPIYQDPNVVVTVGFSRIKGDCELICMVPSYYEYLDIKIFLNLIFGGLDRYIYPIFFNSFIILPPEIYNYEYDNPITGVHYKINIPDLNSKLIKTTNKTEMVIPCRIKPIVKMTSMTDSSTRLGGVDRLPDWRLTFTIEYEVELPTFIVLETDYLIDTIKYSVGYGSCYSANQDYNVGHFSTDTSTPTEKAYNVRDGEFSEESYLESGLIDGTSGIYIQPINPENCEQTKKEKIFNTRYFHIATQSEADSTSTVVITLLERILDSDLIVVSGKYGKLLYGDHYKLATDGWSIIIDKRYVELKKDDMLEIYSYKHIV